MIGNKKPTTNRPGGKRCTANASASASPFEDSGNYVPSRKTLGLELVASVELLAKHSDWNLASSKYSGIESTKSETNNIYNGDRRGTQKQKCATAKSMTAVATKMTTTIRCFLASSQELPSKKKMTLDGNNKGNDGIVLLSDPEKVITSSTTSATTIRRLEANDRDTPSIFSNVRKNRRRKMKQSRQKKFDVSFDENVEKCNAFEGSFSNRDTSIIDFRFGKDTHPKQIDVADDDNSFMQGQAFDSAFNFSVVEAATSIEENIFGKNSDQEQIEVTDDDNFYSERLSFDNGFSSVPGHRC